MDQPEQTGQHQPEGSAAADEDTDDLYTPEEAEPDAATLEPEHEGFRRLDQILYGSEAGADEEVPLTAADRSRVADDEIASGRVNEALYHYREAVRSDDNTENRVRLGDAYAYSGQGLNAFRQYRRAIKTSPRKAEPHFSLAELFHRYGRLQSAIVEYRKAIQFAPANAYYRYKLGDALAQAGDLEGAISELEESSHLKPQDGFYHFWLGDLYTRAGRMDEAIREMQQATLFSPYDAYYNVRLGALYSRAGQMQNAAEAVGHAVSLVPDNAAYHCLLADLYGDLEMHNESIYHYQQAGILDDYDVEMLTRLRRLAGQDDYAALPAPDDE